MQSPEFSFLLPVKNGGDYIKTCIESIFNQTYPKFNLLVLENCSNDGTNEWLKNIEDKRIIIYESPTPLTIEENWARIITIHRNEFMILTGHDDVFKPNYLEVILSLITKYPNASIFTTHFNFIDANGKCIRRCKPMDEKQTGSEFLASLLTMRTDLMGTGYAMHSKDYNQVGGISSNYPTLLFADFTLYHQLSCLSYKATAPDNCFSFRLHQSATFTSNSSIFQQAFKQVVEYIVSLKSKSLVFDNVIKNYGVQFIRHYCKSLSHKLIKSKKKSNCNLTVRNFVNECKQYAKRFDPDSNFQPEKEMSIKLALLVDKNFITRFFFKIFKKIYSKPVL